MNEHKARGSFIPRELNEQFDAMHAAGWTEDSAGTTFPADDIAEFLRIVGDDNPIHRSESLHPILPGFLCAAALPRYLENHLPITLPGFVTVIGEFAVRFVAFVGVSKSLSLRYRALRLELDQAGPKVTFQFQIRVTGQQSPATEGEIALRFIESRLYDLFVRRAGR
jgi:acyl dehydratase